jgi:hypothetical protein
MSALLVRGIARIYRGRAWIRRHGTRGMRIRALVDTEIELLTQREALERDLGMTSEAYVRLAYRLDAMTRDVAEQIRELQR